MNAPHGGIVPPIALSKEGPRWASDANGVVSIAFPGDGVSEWQAALLAMVIVLVAGVQPGLAGLASVIVPRLMQVVRDRTAPKLTIAAESLTVEADGRSSTIARSALAGARIERVDGQWCLTLDGRAGPTVLRRTGGTPTELQWIANLLSAWRAGATTAPSMPTSIVDQGIGATTFVGQVPVAWTDWAGGAYIAALMFAVYVSIHRLADWIPDGAIAALISPIGGLLAHFAVSRRRAMLEVQVRDQAVVIRTSGARIRERTVPIEDIDRIEPTLDGAALHVGAERIALPIGHAIGRQLGVTVSERQAAIAHAEAEARAEDPERVDRERQARAALAALAERGRHG